MTIGQPPHLVGKTHKKEAGFTLSSKLSLEEARFTPTGKLSPGAW